jgi:hypothetical protein
LLGTRRAIDGKLRFQRVAFFGRQPRGVRGLSFSRKGTTAPSSTAGMPQKT